MTCASLDRSDPAMSHPLIYSTSLPMLGGAGHQVTTFSSYPCDPRVQAWPPLAPGVNPAHLLSVAMSSIGQALQGLMAPMLNATRFNASPWMPPIVQFAAPPGLPGMPQSYVPYPSHPPQAFFAPHPAYTRHPQAGGPPPRTPSAAPSRPALPPTFTPTKLDPQAFFGSAAEILESDVSDMVLAHPAPGQPEPAFFAALKHTGQSVIGELPMGNGRTAHAEAIRLAGETNDGSWLLALNLNIPGEPPEHRLIRMHDVKTGPEDGMSFVEDLKRIDASLAKNRCGEEGRTLGVICHDGATESGAVIAGLNALGEADDMRRESRESGTPMPSPGQFARSQREFVQDARDLRGSAYAQGQERELEAVMDLIYEAAQSPGEPAGQEAPLLIDIREETSPKGIRDEPARGDSPTVMDQPVPANVQRQPVLTPTTTPTATVTPVPVTALAQQPQASAAQRVTKGGEEIGDELLLLQLAQLPSPPKDLSSRGEPIRRRLERQNVDRLREEVQRRQLARLPSPPRGLPRSASAPDLRGSGGVGTERARALEKNLATARSESALNEAGRSGPLTRTLSGLLDEIDIHHRLTMTLNGKRPGKPRESQQNLLKLTDQMAPLVDKLRERARASGAADRRDREAEVSRLVTGAMAQAFKAKTSAQQARLHQAHGAESGLVATARKEMDRVTDRISALSRKETSSLSGAPSEELIHLARQRSTLFHTLGAIDAVMGPRRSAQHGPEIMESEV